MRLAVPIIALALVLVGCGSSDDETTTTGGTDRQQVTGVLTGYRAALINGDSEAACGYLTPDRQAALIKEVDAIPNQDVTTCTDASDFLHSLAQAAGAGDSEGPQIKAIAVTGNSAKAIQKSTVKSNNGQETSISHVKLTKTGDGWKIDSVTGTSLGAKG